jgi:hypothetical protein
MHPSLWILLPPACLVVACLGYTAASARRVPVARGKTLKEELRLMLGGAVLVTVLLYAWQQAHVLGELLWLLVGLGLARILGEELGNATLRRRQRTAGGAPPEAEGGPGAR